MNKYLAEGFGTFMLVLVAAGSVLANQQTGGQLGTVGVALAHAFILTAVIYSAWHISGAHVNPAITVTQVITGHMTVSVALGYIAAQLIGSVVAAVALKFMFADVSAQLFLGDTMLGTNVTPLKGILVEALFTFMLAWVVYGSSVSKKGGSGFAGIAAGMILGVAILTIGHLTMGGLNPARSFGPALISMHWGDHFIYWIGPMVGAIAAGVLSHFVIEKH